MDQLARERHVQEKLFKPELTGPVESDRKCTECGYSLRGLRHGSLCPECGHPIVLRRIASSDPLTDLPLEYVRRLARGMWAMSVGCVMVMIIGPILALQLGGPAPAAVLLVGATAFVWGCWAATTPRPGFEEGQMRRWGLVWWVRMLGPVACIPTAALAVISAIPSVAAAPLFLGIAVAGAIAGFLTFLAAMTCLSVVMARLAADLGDQALEQTFVNLSWAFGIAGPLSTPGAAQFIPGPCLLVYLAPLVYGVAQIWFMVTVWRLAHSASWAVRYRTHAAGRDDRLRDRMRQERLDQRQAMAGEE